MQNKNNCTLTLLALLMFAGQMAFTQTASKFSAGRYGEKGDSINYRLLFPDANPLRKYPLIIFLHGSGERGSDNEAQLKWGVEEFASSENMSLHPAIVVAPQCPAGLNWSNFTREKNPADTRLQPSPSKAMTLVMGLIHQLMATMPVDTNRIYITGLSMGGFGTFDAIERYPHFFAAAVPVCGGGDPTRAASIAHLPIWIFHGAEDPAVNPQYALDMVTALTKAGAHPGFTQ